MHVLPIAEDQAQPQQHINISNGIVYGETTVPRDKRIVAFLCYQGTQGATFYFDDFNVGRGRQSVEEYFPPLNCKLDTPVHSSRGQREYIETSSSCENFKLHKNFTSLRLGGYIIRDDKFDYLFSDSYFNSSTTEKDGVISATYSIVKESLKTDTFLLDFYLSIEGMNRSGPISRQEFLYNYPKSFTGETPAVPEGAFAMYHNAYYNQTLLSAERGSGRMMYCIALGNPLPQLSFTKGNTELTGVEEEVWLKYIRSKVMTYFCAPNRKIGGILFLFCLFVCLSVCLFVCLLSTLTFAITFEP